MFVSNAVIGGRYVLRACIVNFHTTAADIARDPGDRRRVGRAVDAECSAHRVSSSAPSR